MTFAKSSGWNVMGLSDLTPLALTPERIRLAQGGSPFFGNDPIHYANWVWPTLDDLEPEEMIEITWCEIDQFRREHAR